MSRRRRTRSRTRVSGTPSSLRPCGIGGLNVERTGAKVAIGLSTFLQKSYRQNEWASLLDRVLHGPASGSVIDILDRLLRNALILLGLAFSCQADNEANRLFQEGQRAEHAGDKLHAYVL